MYKISYNSFPRINNRLKITTFIINSGKRKQILLFAQVNNVIGIISERTQYMLHSYLPDAVSHVSINESMKFVLKMSIVYYQRTISSSVYFSFQICKFLKNKSVLRRKHKLVCKRKLYYNWLYLTHLLMFLWYITLYE